MLVDTLIINIGTNRERTFIPGSHLKANETVIQWYSMGGAYVNAGLTMYLALKWKPKNGDKIENLTAITSGIMLQLKLVCVCVYLSSGFKGQCFNYAIPITKCFPPMTSLPYLGLVVLPLRTPGGIWREGFPTSPCILVGTPWQLLGSSSTT